MKTRNGIYYDLEKSSYHFQTSTGLIYVFSSDLHLTKFEEQYEEHRKDFSMKLKARFRLETEFKNFADIILYKKIETRGFLIIGDGGQKICQEGLILGGERVTQKNYPKK